MPCFLPHATKKSTPGGSGSATLVANQIVLVLIRKAKFDNSDQIGNTGTVPGMYSFILNTSVAEPKLFIFGFGSDFVHNSGSSSSYILPLKTVL